MASMLIGGYLTERYDAKWVLFTALLGGATCTLLVPVIVNNFDKIGLIVLRVIQGLFQVFKYLAYKDLSK